ncbi:MAG TPA: glutamate dehydrogenase, partial [Candidatus Binatia bacterium]
MKSIFDFTDELGPIKIVHIYDPKSGLKAVVAIDNVARGPSIGGIPLDEIGATGWGHKASVEAALKYCNFDLKGARVVIQGFGSVGKHAARFLGEKGTVLVAASDSRGTIYNPRGIDVARLIALKDAGKNVIDYPDGQKLDTDAVIDIECEIWIPAARPDVIRKDNVHRLKAKLVPQGANIPFTPEAERILHEKSTLVIPDFIANAGGVICASVEYHAVANRLNIGDGIGAVINGRWKRLRIVRRAMA